MSARSSSPTPQIFFSAAKSRRASRSSRVISACIGRIVAVAFLELDRQAFGEIARANAGRIEGLQNVEDGLDLRDAGAELFRRGGEVARQITGLVDQIDQVLTDHALHRIGDGERELFAQPVGAAWFRRRRRLRDCNRRRRGRRRRCRPIPNSPPAPPRRATAAVRRRPGKYRRRDCRAGRRRRGCSLSASPPFRASPLTAG